MKRALFAVLLLLSSPVAAQEEGRETPERVIDVHLHFYSEEAAIPPVPYRGPDEEAAAIRTPATGSEHREATLAAMRRNNIVLALVSMAGRDQGQFEIGDLWRTSEGVDIRVGGNTDTVLGDYSLEDLAELHVTGRMFHLGELGLQYRGHTLDEERFEPYLAFAEKRGIPVAVHTGLAPPGQAHGGWPKFRIDAGRPLHLEEVLIRHPKLKLWMMHGGNVWQGETFALMQQFQSVYIDVGPMMWIQEEKPFYEWLEWLVDNGFGNRILFGTDQMLWPQAIDAAVDRIENAPFLTREQKDDIFYNNAVRFFGEENLSLSER